MTVHVPVSEAFSLRQTASGTALHRARASLEKAQIQRPRTRQKREAELAFDPLEKRYLLSADISPYIDTLHDGLDRLEGLAADIESFEEMASEIPVLGDSLGELASLSDTLRTELIDPLRVALASSTDFDFVSDAIEALTGVTVDAEVCDTGEISWDLTFTTQLSLTDLIPDFGTEFAQLGLDFSGSLGATIDLTLDFGFGVLLDPALSPADAGFIDADSTLSVDADANFGTLGTLRVGMLGGASATVGGSASAGVDIGLNSAAGSTATSDGKLTIAEIDAIGAALLTAAVDGAETSFDATIDVVTDSLPVLGDLSSSVALSGVDISFQLVDDLGAPASVFTATDIKVTFNDDALADFTRINAGTLLTFLASLGDKIQTLSNAFQELTDFDLFDVSFDKIADYAQAFETLVSALTVPGMVGSVDADLSDIGTHTFKVAYTIVGPDGAEIASSTTGAITFDFSAADVLATLSANINAALPASAPDVEVVLEQGRLVLRGLVDGASDNVFAELALQDVATAITDAVGWQEDQTALLLPTFRTIQDFADAILDVPVISSALTDIGLAYADGALTFNLDILNEVLNQSIAFNFSQGLSLGALGELSLTGSAAAELDSTIGLSFGAGIDLSALAAGTNLSELNGGLGVDFSTGSGPDLMFTTADGSVFDVTFAPTVTTVGQMIDAINAAGSGKITFEIDDLGNGFKITDNTITSTTTGRLTIAGGSDSHAIYDIGFGFGLATEVGQADLSGDFVIQRFFIDPAATTMGASVTATASDINLYGSLGFVTFGVQGGQLGGTLANDADLYGARAGDTLDPLHFGLSLELNDPIDDGRLYLREMEISERGGDLALDTDGLSGNDLDIEIQLSDGTNVTVDLSAAATVDAAVAAINASSADIDAILNAAGNAIEIFDKSGGSTQPFAIVDPGTDANSLTRQLGFALSGTSADGDDDGRITGATIGGFVAVDTVDFTADPLTGELVLPIIFDGLEVLGLGTEPIVISVGFSKGSILSEATVDGDLTALFDAISNLGTQDLFEIIRQIVGVINNEIDILNADLPLLGTSISDLLGAINDEFGGVIATANEAIADGLVTLVEGLEAKFADLVEALDAFDPQAAVDFLDTVEAQTLLVALSDLRAVVENLATDGFDLLFDNVPGKLLSAAAALRGTLERIASKAEEAGTNIYDTIVAQASGVIGEMNDILEQVDDISPNAETVLRILQEALGFDLPDLDDVLSDALPAELAAKVDSFLDEILGEADHASKTIEQIIGDIAVYAEGVQQDVISKIEAFIADAEDTANGAVDDAIAKLQDILDALIVRVLGTAEVAVGGLTDEIYNIGITLDELTEVVLEIDGDGITSAQQLIDAINAEIVGTDLEGEVQAVLDDTGHFVLKSIGDAQKIVLSTVDDALESALSVVEAAESLTETIGALLSKLQNLDGATIFTIIKDLPFVSDVVQKLDEVFKAFLTVDIADVLDYADNNAELDLSVVEDLVGGLQGMVDGLVDNLRGSILSVFGGGVLNFDIDTETGQVDIGLHYAPSFYSLDPADVDLDFSLDILGGGGDLADFGFGAGFTDSALTLDIGGYLDLGFVIDLIVSPDGGFGSDFDLYIDPDSAAGLTVDFSVAGQFQVQLGAVGVIFGSDDLTSPDPFLRLTDLSGYGPAFLALNVTGAPVLVDARSLVPITAAGIGATAEAKLDGTLYAYDLDEDPINWDSDGMGDIQQVSFGLTSTVSFTGGEFDFTFSGNPLESGEVEAIFQSLIKFDLSLILDAFEFFLDGLEDLLNYLAEAPIIGDGFDPIATAYETLNGYFQDFISEVETIADENVEEFVRDALFDLLGTVTIADGVSLGLFTSTGEAIDETNYETEIGVDFVGGPRLDDALTYLQGGNSPALIIDPLKIGLRLEQDVKFDFGLDALVVDVQGDGQVAVDLDLFLNIGFGLGLEEGAFLVMPDGDTKVFEGTFDASIEGDGTDPASLQLGLFFLGLEATPWETDMQTDYPGADFPDAPTLAEITAEHPGTFDGSNDPRIGEGVGFSAMVSLDLLDGGAPLGTATTIGSESYDIAVLTEIGDLGVETEFVIEVDIDLLLRGGVSFTSGDTVDENFPSLFTWLNIDWTWDFDGGDENGLSVQFYDLSLDIGEALTATIGGVADSILRFIEPLQPFLDFLDMEIPIISDLAVLFGQDPVTFLDAIAFLGSGAESVQVFLDILVAVENTLTALEDLGNGFVNFGDFIVSASPGIDLRDLGSREMLQSDGLFNGNLGGSALISSPEEDLGDQIDGATGGLFDSLFEPLNDFGLYLPFLQDPAQLFGVLFGQRIDFVIWDIPKLSAEFGVSYKFGPILPPVPLFVTIAGGFEIFLDLAVGYDSRGLETGDFFDGFFFVDGALDGFNIDASKDPLELGLSVFFEATASLSVLVAEAGVTGGVEAIIGANWADRDGDGKFYLDELLNRAAMGIFCIFDLEGALEAYLEAFVKLGFDTPFGFVTIFEDAFELLRITLLDFNVSCPPLPPPVLGEQDADGAVLLNIGTRAGDRQPGADGNDDEYLQIFGDRTADEGETVSLWKDGITAAEITAAFSTGVIRRADIQGNLGLFNTELDINRDGNIDTDEILAAFDLDGGFGGADGYALIVGFGEWELYRNVSKLVGDAAGGDDEIVADCDSVLFDLEIYGGAGEDTLIGGQGEDTLIGGADADIVKGCLGDDLLLGDGTAANAGNATDGWFLNITNFITGDGADAVYGGGGGDLMYGGGGNDTIRGDGDENNPGLSQDGNDTIFGNEGEDQIDGFLGNDVILGGRGADNISGDQGNDTIRGDYDGITPSKTPDMSNVRWASPNDTLGEIDLITGGDGNDFIRGDGGNDIIYGEDTDITGDETGNFNDTIHGDGGGDEIRGQLGQDKIYGGLGNDRLIGGADNDSIFGNAGSDTILGDRLSDDGLPEVSGNDYIEGGAGSDSILGQGGIDWILGGIDTASVQGDFAVYAYSGSGDSGDSIYGGNDDDIILGDDGRITATNDYASQTDGTGGNDLIYAGTGDDQVAGGRGADTIHGDPSGGTGQDILVGDEVVRDGILLESSRNAPADGDPETDLGDRIFGYGGNDIIIAGGGNDTAFGSAGDDIVAGDYATLRFKSALPANLFDDTAWLRSIDPGFGGNDRLIGDSGADIMLGGFGNDEVYGGSPTDDTNILFGDSGLVVRDIDSPFKNDVFSIYGDLGGNDLIVGGGVVDIAIGGTGDDTMLTLGGTDIALGDAGFVLRNDALNPETVSTSFFGTAITGTNIFDGVSLGLSAADPLATGQDYIDAGSDNDIAMGGLDADLIYGRTGNDVLLGDNGEVIYNGAGAGLAFVTEIRTLGTDGGIDAIFGEAGGDIAFAGAAGDYVFGDLTATIARDGNDFDVPTATFAGLTGVDDDIAGDDILGGDFGQLLLSPAGVYDILQSTDPANGGSDLIEGHEGNDIAFGGAFGDEIHGEAAADRYDLLEVEGFGSDTLIGDSGYIDFDAGSATGYDVIRTDAAAIGGSDVILGNEGADIVMGGMAGDFLYGDRIANVDFGLATRLTNIRLSANDVVSGEDTILGDNGEMLFEQTSGDVAGRNDVSGFDDLAAMTTVIQSTVNAGATDGGNDLILGDGMADLIMGGLFADRIWGDEGGTGNDEGDDLIFGDNGLAWQRAGKGGALEIGDDYYAILTAANQGLGDAIFAEGGEDTVMGQQGDDVIFGGTGNDNLIGGHNTEGGIDELDNLTDAQVSAITGNDTAGSADLSVLDPTDLQNVNDVIDGEEGEDIIAGDNAYFYQWGGQATGAGMNSLRFQELIADADLYSTTGELVDIPLYADTDFFVDLGFAPNIIGTGYDFGILNRNLYLLDFDKPTQDAAAASPTQARPFGDDVITGGIDDDEVYGGLGDDVVQGDGMIEIGPNFTDAADIGAGQHDFKAFEGDTGVLVNPNPNATASNDLKFVVGSSIYDGDDYIEGNGGNDRLYGNLGQDDIVGGSSGLAALQMNSDVAPVLFNDINVYPGLRPDGADLIFGGSADAGWLTRNADHTDAGDSLVGDDNFHTADADMILGDNGNIYRLVDVDGDPLSFNYASGAGYDGLEIRVVELLDYAYTIDDPDSDGVLDWKTTFHDFGNGAGDLIHGESGDDTIHGMTGDDLLLGEAGDDDIYGEAGADAIFGGRGVDGIIGDDGLLGTSRNGMTEELIGLDVANAEEIIRTPGNLQIALIYREGHLLKDAKMIAFDLDGVTFGSDWQAREVTSANDIVFGGWGDDFIHSGYGDDAVSGAEAMPVWYPDAGDDFTALNALLVELHQAGANTDEVADSPFWGGYALVNPGDVLGFGAQDDEEFLLYDEDNPRVRIFVDGAGLLDVEWLLNNDAADGIPDLTFSFEVSTDGADHLFGDLGNDWIVGGTGRDHMFGGRGNDLLQMDDDIKLGPDAKKPDPYQEYADIAYDGAGRDYLILNTGADRAIGWVGEYNSYIVPFSPFGAFQIARLLQPQTEQFVLDLADASGADESTPDILRFAEQAAIDDKLDNPLATDIYDERKGSPFNELGMVRQEDFDWTSQTGPPDDPQAGNTQGPRQIMRREIWDGELTQAQLNQLEADEWFLVQQAFNEAYGDVNRLELIGKVQISDLTQMLGTIGVEDAEFDSVVMSGKVEVDKPGKKDSAEAYFLFDVVDDQNFKFAGLDIQSNMILVGTVVNGVWTATNTSNEKLRATTEYNLQVELSGSTVKVLINGVLEITADMGDDVTDGSYGIAAADTKVNFKDLVVQGNEAIIVTSEEAFLDPDLATVSAATTTATTDVSTETLLVDWSSTTIVETGTESTATTTTSEPLTFTTTETQAMDYSTTDPATSSDTSGTDEEVVIVEAWAPRDDFAA